VVTEKRIGEKEEEGKQEGERKEMREKRGPKVTAMIFIKMKQNNEEKGGIERGGRKLDIPSKGLLPFRVI